MSEAKTVVKVSSKGEVELLSLGEDDLVSAALKVDHITTCTGYFMQEFIKKGMRRDANLAIFCDDVGLLNGSPPHVWNPVIRGDILIIQVDMGGETVEMKADIVQFLERYTP